MSSDTSCDLVTYSHVHFIVYILVFFTVD